MSRGEVLMERRLRSPLAVCLAGLAWSCGGGSQPSPVPTAAPVVASRAFVHALDPTQQVLTTFEVVPETGLLKPQGSVPVKAGSLGQIDADPKGGFVYVGGVVGFAVNATNGTLSQVSSFGNGSRALVAGAGSLFVLDHSTDFWTLAVGANGSLTRLGAPTRGEGRSFLAAEPQGRFVYSDGYDRRNLTQAVSVTSVSSDGSAHTIVGYEPTACCSDGALVAGRTLVVTDSSNRTITSFRLDPETGLPSSRFLREDAYTCTTCAPIGGPKRHPGLAFGATGLVAVSTESRLQLFGVGPSGELTSRDDLSLASSTAPGYVAFHPSGRFLYLSRPREGVSIYAVEAGDRLRFMGTQAGGGDALAVTAPPG